MRFLRNMSLRSKLVAMGTTFLLVWCGLYAFYIPYKLREITATWFEDRAEGVAAALESGVRPALEFDDARALEEQFKVLAPKLNLSYVGVFRVDGARLGGYKADLAGETLMPPAELHLVPMGNQSLRVEYPIDGRDGRLGTLVLGMSPEEIQSNARAAVAEMLQFSVIVLLLGIVGASFFGRWMSRPIEDLAVLANRIATGDLSGARKLLAETGDDAADEVGRLRSSFRTMVSSLTDAVSTLQRTGAELSAVGIQLTKLTERQTDTISRQAAALQETQVTADEIKQTSALATRKAEAVLEAASNADHLGQTGEEALAKSVSGLEEIRQHVASIASQITALNSRAMQIGGITNTVKELADQSNLLALNAAIEAARSGEHGRAFSVVAREIRSLADESIQSTVRVGEILSAFAGDARDGVGIAERGMSRVDAGITQVRTSGEHLRQLAAIIQDNSVSARQIAAAVNQQNAGIEQIFNALAELSQMMQDTVTGVEEARGSTVALNSVARQISDVVERYKV